MPTGATVSTLSSQNLADLSWARKPGGLTQHPGPADVRMATLRSRR